MMSRRLLTLWWSVWAYMAMLFGLSSLRNVPAGPPMVSDTLVHMLLYAGLATVVLRAVAHGTWRRVTLAASLTATLIAVTYGIFDEIHQAFVPPRTFQIRDIISDAIGASLASGGLWAWSIIRPRTPPDIPYVL